MTIKTLYQQRDNLVLVRAEVPEQRVEALPVGTYAVCATIELGFHLKGIQHMETPGKIYGSIDGFADRILTTYNARDVSTGVLLAGEKGSGKSLLTKVLSTRLREQGISTLIVNAAFCGDGFNMFVQMIKEPVLIIFDEFEKVYREDHEQQALLTLLDGTYSTKKLFVLTTNDKWRIDRHMRNRPGRLFYNLDFRGMTESDIREYCAEKLDDKGQTDNVCRFAGMFSAFNFDMLKALVEEMNRYREPASTAFKMLNVKPLDGNDKLRYSVVVTYKDDPTDVVHGGSKSYAGVPFAQVRDSDGDTDTYNDADQRDNSIKLLVRNPAYRFIEKPSDRADMSKYMAALNENPEWISVDFEPTDIRMKESRNGSIVAVNKDGYRAVFMPMREKFYDYSGMF